MVNRFTETAKKALNLAKKAAEELGAGPVGTEHLLLGLTRVSEGLAYEVLSANGIFAQDITDLITKYLVQDYSVVEFGGYEYTPMSTRILSEAVDKARLYKSALVGTEHILMAILSFQNCSACRLLTAFNISLERLHVDLVSAIQDGSKKTSGAQNPRREQRNGEGKESAPTLQQYSRDLTEQAARGQLDPVIGREREIQRIIQILSRRTKNNPCLIGEPGVGKTAVVEGLAQRIADGMVPDIMKDKKLLVLDLSGMVAGSKYRGEFEERIKNVIAEASADKSVMLFIDEIHTIIGAGGAEGSLDAANIIKPALSRGEIQLIGATTISEYRKHIEKDAALERRFQPVTVEEPSEEECVEILRGLRPAYEEHHRVEITDDALESAVKLSARYISDRFQPDKSIDLIDEAASKVRLSTYVQPKKLKSLKDELNALEKEKEEAVFAQEFELAGDLKRKQDKLRQKIDRIHENWEKAQNESRPLVTGNEIADVVSGWTKIPVKSLQETEANRLKNMEETLHKRVVSQDEAVSAVSKAIRRGRVGLKDPKRPIGSFLFLGPTGVGKTELCKALAEALFGTENAMIRVDMSEYMEKHSVSKLIGSPPGYVGFEEGGQLSEKVRRNPYSVLLFDEIEKAHPDVFNILLQVLDDGRLTDSQGRVVDFKNTVIILTSNLGSQEIIEAGDQDFDKMREAVLAQLRRHFRPEFLNRLDATVFFRRLEKEQIASIVKLQLAALAKRVEGMRLHLEVTPAACQAVADEGYDPVYGARPLKRVIINRIENPLSVILLGGKAVDGDTIVVGYEGERSEFTFDVRKP